MASPSGSARARDVLHVALLLAGFLALAARLWFVCDDAYISFRYARHLADGEGLRYNLGDEAPVEGYSNFLWVLLAALVRRVGLDMVVWMPRLSCACGVVLIVWLHRVLRRRFECSPESAALATASMALFPPYAAWSSSGLETLPFALAVFATFERLVLRREGPDGRGGAVAGVGLLLVRVDGFAWCVALGLLAAFVGWRAGTEWRRPLLKWAFAVALVFAAFLLHRRLHFERWISNTATAKIFLDPEQLVSGRNYLVVFALTFLSPLVVVVSATWMASRWRRDPAALAIAALCVAFPAFALLVGGDFMCMGRLLVPGFAIEAIALGVLLRDLADARAWRRGASVVLGLALVVVGLLPIASLLPRGPAADLHLVSRHFLERFHFRLNTQLVRSEREQWEMQKHHAAQLALDGKTLAAHTKPGESIVQGAIGAIGYYTDLFVYDRYGLVTREVAEAPPTGDRKRSPGHDRAVPKEFFAGRYPTYLDRMILPMANQRAIAETLANWRGLDSAAVYAPRFVPLPVEERPKREVLVLLEHTPDPRDVELAWQRAEQQYPEMRGVPGAP